MKICDVIRQIEIWHEPFTNYEDCRDRILMGDGQLECTGVAVTVCANYEVLRKAKEQNLNLIITHESIFYGSRIDPEEINCNEVYKAKMNFINDNNLVVWRDHDRIHGNVFDSNGERSNHDLIFYGICKKLGWENYIMGDKMKPLWYKIPEIKARDLARLLIEKFQLNGIRTIGDLESNVSTIWFCEHVMGGMKDGIKINNAEKADAIIPLEICDYTLSQYVKDSSYMRKPKVLLEMGHFNCEELGMQYIKECLQDVITQDIPIEFIKSGDLFEYIGGYKNV